MTAVLRPTAEQQRAHRGLLDAKGPGDGARNLADFEGVGQPRAVVIPLGSEEDLGLALQAAERLRVEDPVAVALEGRAQRALLFLAEAADRMWRRGEHATHSDARRGGSPARA